MANHLRDRRLAGAAGCADAHLTQQQGAQSPPQPYHAQAGAPRSFNAVPFDPVNADDAGGGRAAQMGIWAHGNGNSNKRMRPNDYDPTSRSSSDTLFPPVPYGAAREAEDSVYDSYVSPPNSFQANAPYPESSLEPASASYPAQHHGQPYISSAWEHVDHTRSDTGSLNRQSSPSRYQSSLNPPPVPQASVCSSPFYGSTDWAASTGMARGQWVETSSGTSSGTAMGPWTGTSSSYNAGAGIINLQNPSSLFGQDASLHLKLQSLAILDNLATQIILNLAKPSLSEIMRLTNNEDSEESQAYVTRKNLFDQTRKVYSRDAPFIDAIAIQLFTPGQQEIIRKANKATFISSILEGHDVSFFDLNEFFLEIFVPGGQRLLKWQGGIFLELKTQVYISGLMNSDGPVDPLLEELFPHDLEDRLTARHPDAPNLAPSEQDFLDRARARKQYLLAEPACDALATLPQKYEWQDFLREFSSCVSKNVETILNPPARQPNSFAAHSHHDTSTNRRRPRQQFASVPVGVPVGGPGNTPGPGGLPTDPSDVTAQPAYSSFGALGPSHVLSTTSPDSPPAPAVSTRRPSPTHPSTTMNNSTPRQPWKPEEEEALLTGLTDVAGPHWSQILSLYGRGGSVSEVLKDRNQIQLKDKARNLKLWYLKMGQDVPACLRSVTGELRKRGGARVRAALLGVGDRDRAAEDGDEVSGGGAEGAGSGGRGGAGAGRKRGRTAVIDPAL